jgi:uncharacterized protein with PhoU and TrkA domain
MPSIKENLLEMKNISELMTDLAYSAVFLRDKSISSEVIKLYHKIQELEKDTLKMLFRIKESEDERMFIIELTSYIRELAYDAVGISRLSHSISFPSIVKDILKESDKRIIVDTVSKKSKLANKTISESEIRTKTKATIIAIKRKNDWIFNIDTKVKIFPNDMIVAVGRAGSEALLKELLS